MKNFALAFVTFFIWTLIGYGFHILIHPENNKSNSIVLPKSKPVNNLIKDKKLTKDTISKIKKELAIPKKILYLGFDKKDFQETQNIDNYIKDLKKYITANKNTQIYITGFTDSIGDEKDNYWIGLERANNFKNFLIAKHIKKERIHTSSEGEKNPLTKNSSLVSRRKNRRIEIIIKPN